MDAYGRRRAALASALASSGTAAAIVGPGPDLRYLTGYAPPELERPTLLVVPAGGPPLLVVPRLEEARAADEAELGDGDLRSYGELDDPFSAVIAAVGPDGPVAVGDRLWTATTLQLQSRLPGRVDTPASTYLGPLRARKDDDELAALRTAADAIDAVHRAVPALLRPGRTEIDVARELSAAIRERHDDVAFVIVAAGPNAASPHHEPGPRPLESGDAVVVDIGGVVDGYHSDMTRTYHLGPADPDVVEAYAALEAAQRAGVEAVLPGVTAGAIDAAAREVLEAAGLGAAFIHRTGHGIGLEVHEQPWILPGGATPLEPGMAFSVEPGYYLGGRTGARIEDIVVVTADGVDVLNREPRHLVVV